MINDTIEDNINDSIEDNINNIINGIVDKIEYNNYILCGICLEIIKEKNNCITNCGHSFCLSCILISSEYKNNCPYCRNKLYSKYNLLENEEVNNNEDSEEEDEEEDDDNIQVQQLLFNVINNQNQNQNQRTDEEQNILFNNLQNIFNFSNKISFIFTTIKIICIRTCKFLSFIILTSFGIHLGIQLSNYFLHNVCIIKYENIRSNVNYNNNSY